MRCFNPRAREGRDKKNFVDLRVECVSIHAPARGATVNISVNITQLTRFQSTRPRGARRKGCFVGYSQFFQFQSTRPRGARHKVVQSQYQAEAFQSTRPRGARQNFASQILPFLLFQSTRPRGARLFKSFISL